MKFRRLYRHRKLDKRLDDARERSQQAAGELELSKERARDKKENVVKPLRRRAEENQFGEMLRRSLQVGYGNGDQA